MDAPARAQKKLGALAQLGERLICIQEVRSSILLGSTNSSSLRFEQLVKPGRLPDNAFGVERTFGMILPDNAFGVERTFGATLHPPLLAGAKTFGYS